MTTKETELFKASLDSLAAVSVLRYKYDKLKSDLRKLVKDSEKDQKLTHLIDSLSNIVERMEVIAKDQQWDLLDEGYKQATSDWAFELKQLLEEKGGE